MHIQPVAMVEDALASYLEIAIPACGKDKFDSGRWSDRPTTSGIYPDSSADFRRDLT